MPIFYFHVCDGSGFVEDEEGRELPGADAAYAEAMKGARGIMASEVEAGVLPLSAFIEVEDENHELLFTLNFRDLLQIDTSPPARSPRS